MPSGSNGEKKPRLRTSGYWVDKLVGLWNAEEDAIVEARQVAELAARARTKKRMDAILEGLEEHRRGPVLAAAKAMWSAQVKVERAKEDADGEV